jgi:hypothetical protein
MIGMEVAIHEHDSHERLGDSAVELMSGAAEQLNSSNAQKLFS